jgi:hypothetical protein
MAGISGNGRPKRPADVAVPGRSDAQVTALVQSAWRHALSVTKASTRDAARWMRVPQSTVHRWLVGKTPVNPLKVLRSRRLSRPFLLCLRVLDRRNGRAA